MATSFKFNPLSGLPRMIKQGENNSLEIFWYEDDVLITNVSGTMTLKQGSKVIATPTVFTGSPDFTATVSIGAGATDGLPYSDTMLEIWSLTKVIGGDLKTVTVRHSGHLVRTLLHPMIIDADLQNRHARILDILPPSETSFEKYRNLAWEILNRDLIKQGRRPELVLDSYALIDMHVYKSLELIFRDAITFVGDGRYNELSDMYAEKYKEEWMNVSFRYDRSEDDAIQDSELESASPSIWLGEPPPGWPNVWPRGS